MSLCRGLKILIFLLCSTSAIFSQTVLDFENKMSIIKEHHLSNNRDKVLKSLDELLGELPNQFQEDDSVLYKKSFIYNQLGLYLQSYGKWAESAQAYNEGISLLSNSSKFNQIKSRLYLNLGLHN